MTAKRVAAAAAAVAMCVGEFSVNSSSSVLVLLKVIDVVAVCTYKPMIDDDVTLSSSITVRTTC